MSTGRFPFRSTDMVTVAQALGLLTIAYVLTPAATRPGLPNAVTGALFLAQTVVAIAACAVATRRAGGTRRLLFASLTGAIALIAIGAAVWLGRELATGAPPRVPVIEAIVGITAQLILAIGLGASLGRRRNWMGTEALLDALLLVAAAVIVIVQIERFTERAVLVSGWLRGASLLWDTLATANLILVALLLAWRGEVLGLRVASGLTLGAIFVAIANFLYSHSVLLFGGEIDRAVVILWSLTILCWVTAVDLPRLTIPAQSGELPSVGSHAWKVRIFSIVVAILIAAFSAAALGLRSEPDPALGMVIAIFGVLLAARAGQALWVQHRTTTTLASTVEAEREVSVTLEQRVGSRTRELADTQRVLQRMWTLAQQIAVELSADRVLSRFLEAAVDVVQADGGVVALVAEDRRLQIAASSGVTETLRGQHVSMDGSAMGNVVRSGDVWYTEDVQLHGRPASLAEAEWKVSEQLVRGVAVIPLQRRGERIGAVTVVSRSRRWFSDEEIARVEAMTDLLSVALANADLIETLRKTEWRFRTLFRAAPDAVLTVLESGRVREANDAVRDILGVPPIQVIGKSIDEFAVPEDRDRLRYEIAQALAGAPSRLEVRFEHERGVRTVSLAARMLPEAEPPTVLFVGRDITGEREMRTRLAETERLAAVGELVAGVAHEVNNPLSTISAFAQLLLRDGHLAPDQRESIEVIRAETVRASQVLKDLLTFARRSESQRQRLEVSEIVERTLRLRGYEMTSGGITLETDFAENLPPVSGDARQLQQVLLNLVTNAMQAMSPRGGTLRVFTRRDGDQVVIGVEDTGCGIAPDVRERVFEPFFTTKSDGTGLGLSVSYGIVTAHGGTIEIAESTTKGTTFQLCLPVADGESEPVPGVVGPSTFLERAPLKGIRVLFVDDEPSLRSGMKAFGRLRRFRVETAPDGQAALELARAQEFDAVVCDLRMPGMDGPTLYEHLKVELPALAARTLFITGDTVSESSRAFLDSTAQPVLSKPFEFERLEELLVGLVSGARAEGLSRSA
ncbi:MAG TPA: ATP-binding protein [Gemmatimonadaceae bacterium]|jgi:two-component system NtrC family sensor kinase|nr:ATP-binding protein [Gemmatimonadaceae bacterium]